jgi:hypothetical protein
MCVGDIVQGPVRSLRLQSRLLFCRWLVELDLKVKLLELPEEL